jgi:hypothetical protein
MGKIKLQKNNKYAGRRAIGLTDILAALIAFIIVGSSMACGFPDTAYASTNPPVETAVVIKPSSTPNLSTPVQTPVNTPIASPTPVSIEDQLKKLITVEYDMDEYEIDFSTVTVFYYKVNGEDKYIFSIPVVFQNEKDKVYIKDMFSEKDVFSVSKDVFLKTLDEFGTPKTEDYTVYPESYDGKNVELVDCYNINEFPNKLMWKDGREIFNGYNIMDFFNQNNQTATLKSFAMLYLQALAESEKVFSNDLNPKTDSQTPPIETPKIKQ